jgi:TldD protein
VSSNPKQHLLDPVGLETTDIQNTLDKLMAHDVDAADLYFEASRAESWVMEDSIIREGSHSIDQGVGVRAISGEKTGFAYSDEIVLPALSKAALAARAIAKSGGDGKLPAWQQQNISPLYLPDAPMDSISSEDKVALLKKVDEICRRKDPEWFTHRNPGCCQ